MANNKKVPIEELKLCKSNWYTIGSAEIAGLEQAAKEILAEALNSRNMEFVFNHPGHNVDNATTKNYFNVNFMQRVMLRISKSNAGAEEEILMRLKEFYRNWQRECQLSSQASNFSAKNDTPSAERQVPISVAYGAFFAAPSETNNNANHDTKPTPVSAETTLT